MSKFTKIFAVLFAAATLAACDKPPLGPSPEAKKELEKFQALCKKHPSEPECTAGAGGPN